MKKHFIQKTTCFLLAFALLVGTVFFTPVSVNAALKNIVNVNFLQTGNSSSKYYCF